MNELYQKILFRDPYNIEYEIFKKTKLDDIEKTIIKTNEYKEIINYKNDNIYFIKNNYLNLGDNFPLVKNNFIKLYKLYYFNNINENNFIDFIEIKSKEFLNKNNNKNLVNMNLINFIKNIYKFLINNNNLNLLEELHNKNISIINSIKYNIAILLHIGEYDLWPTVLTYIKNVLDLTNADLYINITKYGDKRDLLINDLEKKILDFKKDTYIIINDNIGMDIGGFLQQLKLIKQMNKKYLYILKLHTKRNDIWRNELYNPIIGSKEIINNCLNVFENNNQIGMISCKKWLMNMDNLNTPIINNITRLYNLKNNQSSMFVGGTVFWIRYNILDTFFNIKNIDNIYKTLETGHSINPKPTNVHSWERMFGVLINSYNYKYYSFN